MDLNSEPTEPPEIENLTRSGSLPDHFKYYFEQGSVEAVKRIAAAQSELSKECALNQRLVDGTRRWVFGIVNIVCPHFSFNQFPIFICISLNHCPLSMSIGRTE